MRLRNIFALCISPMVLSAFAVAILVAAPLADVPAQRRGLIAALDERNAAHDYTVALEKDILEALAGLSGDFVMGPSTARLEAWGGLLDASDAPAESAAAFATVAAAHASLREAVANADLEAVALAYDGALDAANAALADANDRIDRRMAGLASSTPEVGIRPMAEDARTQLEESRAAARYARAIGQIGVEVAVAGPGDNTTIAFAILDAERHADALSGVDNPATGNALLAGALLVSTAERLAANRTLGSEGLAQLWQILHEALTAIDAIYEDERLALRDGLADIETRATVATWIAAGSSVALVLAAIVSVWVLRRRVLQPTLALHAAIEDWSGEAPAKIPVAQRDELGELARSFEDMSSRITEATRRLRGALDRSTRDREALEASYKMLSKADRLRSHILNTASHELRTPLTPMRLQLRLLKDGTKGPLNESQERAVQALDDNLRRLVQVIEEMTQLHELQEGELDIELTAIDAAAVAQETAQAVRPAFEKDGIDLEVRSPETMPATGDHARLRQVMEILLDNARRFTPEGGHVVISVTHGPAIEVIDDGEGMSEEDVGRLFRPFERGLGREDTKGAAGLGLAIARAVVERMGGAISGESPGPGQGSTFRIRLEGPSL